MEAAIPVPGWQRHGTLSGFCTPIQAPGVSPLEAAVLRGPASDHLGMGKNDSPPPPHWGGCRSLAVAGRTQEAWPMCMPSHGTSVGSALCCGYPCAGGTLALNSKQKHYDSERQREREGVRERETERERLQKKGKQFILLYFESHFPFLHRAF